MEYGDDQMILTETPPQAKKVVNIFTKKAKQRARSWGKVREVLLDVVGEAERFLNEAVLYLSCLVAPTLKWNLHKQRRAALIKQWAGFTNTL